jgi:hypothetical protein
MSNARAPRIRRGRWLLDAVIAELDRINDRADLVGFIAPLRLPRRLTNNEQARVLDALIKATARAWKTRE